MLVNVLLALRRDTSVLLTERLEWDEEADGEYDGPVPDRAYRIFQAASDFKRYRIDTDGGADWVLWSLYFSGPKNILIKVRDELDWLASTYPNRVKIGGAWHYDDGRQVGTTIQYDEDGVETGVTGTPVYPIHPRLLEFMPDLVERDADGVEVSRVRPTMLSDVNLLQGQKERRFV